MHQLMLAFYFYFLDFPAVDLNNVGKGKGGGGACTAAAFLKVTI